MHENKQQLNQWLKIHGTKDYVFDLQPFFSKAQHIKVNMYVQQLGTRLSKTHGLNT